MTELIPLISSRVGAETIPTVDARKLHAFLDVKTRFNDWIAKRIAAYGFLQDIDYCVLTLKYEGPISSKDYFLALDMAKELAMVERTPKGKEARQYFIACEKAVKEQSNLSMTQGDILVQMAVAYRDQQKQLKAIEDQQRQDQLAIIQTQKEMLALQQDHMALQQGVIEAKDNALLAIQSMQWVTIRQYVEIYRLHREVPPSLQRRYAIWLTTYCLEHNSAMYKAATADKEWPHEKTYCIAIIQDTLAGWLARYRNEAQGLLSEQGDA